MIKQSMVGLLLGSLFSGVTLAENKLEEIIVKSSPLHRNQADMAQFASVLEGERLREQVARSLGETLSGELGVFSSSFGPNVGRPVIRGQGGERVLVLQDGVGALDASTISPDHAVTLEPVLAERIEVIRGPNTLVYGSGAIGGVVNVIDGRIPERLSDEPLSGAFEQRHSSVSDEDVSVFKLQGSLGKLAYYLDGVYRESNNTDIDGFALRAIDHGDEEDEESEDHDAEQVSGYIENTSSRAKGGSFGLSWINGDNFIGIAVNQLRNNYGVPPGAHEHAHEGDAVEEENIRINMEQTRYELKSILMAPFKGVTKISAKLAYNDYQHTELEGKEVGTRFENQGVEGRAELTHQSWRGIHGVLGVQWQEREFSAVGDEAFVPPAETDAYGLFLVQDFHRDSWVYEWGLRYERQLSEAQGFHQQAHDLISLSASAVWSVSDTTDLSLILSRAQRAPAIEELFSHGFHAATNSYEIGDAQLNKETALNMELSLRQRFDAVNVNLSAFYNHIDDFIFESATGQVFDHELESIALSCASSDCVEVFQYAQQNATFIGAEAEVTWQLSRQNQLPFELRLFTDYVRAKLDQGGDVPRIPPWRYGVELRHQRDYWDAFVRTTLVADQNRPGDHQEKTDGFTDLSVGINVRLSQGRLRHTLFLQASNLLDEEMRNAVSFLRDIAPQPGRSLSVGYRGEF